jgi:hypothetical protein
MNTFNQACIGGFIGVLKTPKQFNKFLCMTLKLESSVQYMHAKL